MQGRIKHVEHKWELSIEVGRGLCLATRPPRLTDEVPDPGVLLKGEWPGLWRWVLRFLIGPSFRVSSETRFLRAWVFAVTAPQSHQHVGRLTHGELAVFVRQYATAQRLWMGRIDALAERDLSPAAAAASDQHARSQNVATGRTLVLPDGTRLAVPAAPAPGAARGTPFVPEIFEAMNKASQGGLRLNGEIA